MIGIIVTGHGGFASGMMQAVKLIAGTPEKFVAIDYLQEDSADDLEFKIRDAILAMKEECTDGILLFTDIVDGTPFRESQEMVDKMKDVKLCLMAGVNLGMIVQTNMARGYISDIDDLSDMASEQGKKQIYKYVPEEKGDTWVY